ncbi:MAG: FAD-dependent oxidoreductase [Actinobacteria bacterium]|nr:FAD-dependent oxidoreductase [Actinomycetota bacterium]
MKKRHSERRVIVRRYDLVVVGGGLAGVCAAIATARLGVKTALIQDRPVLGGNSSSEIRVNVGGANDCNGWARETGIIEELILEDRCRNHDRVQNGAINSVWDMVLYDWVTREQNLDLYLDTHVSSVEKKADKIEAVTGLQTGSERNIRFQSPLFVDATGDGTVGALAGAQFRHGRESRAEFDESLAPKKADGQTQGSTLLFRARDTGKPAPFTPPDWAEKYPTEKSFCGRNHEKFGPKEYAGYWWIEVGSPFHTIEQNDEIRHEILRHVLGVWDHIKNHGDHDAENLAIDWIGMVPGKRESRRLVGDYILTQNDLLQNTPFPDRVAYGGWFIDLHTIGGILEKSHPPLPKDRHPMVSDDVIVRTYNIPLRSLYSKNVSNLFLAGRDISVSSCAFGSTRLMLTCATTGQAVGTAAYVAKRHRCSCREVANKYIKEVQQLLVKNDALVLDMPNSDPKDLARSAKVTASSTARLRLEMPSAKKASKSDETIPPWIGDRRSVSTDRMVLDTPKGQIFPVSADRLKTLSLYVISEFQKDTELTVELASVKDIWSFVVPTRTNSVRAKATIPAFHRGWVKFDFNMNIEPGLFQLCLPRKKGLSVACAESSVPGVCAAWKQSKWTRWDGGLKVTIAMRLDPVCYPFEANNVISGTARPERWTNLWMSDPQKNLPQSLTLQWGEPKEFDTAYITFDTFLHYDPTYLPPFWKAKECVKNYRLEARVNKKWKPLATVKDNYQRRRVHRFANVRADRLRLTISATNGDPSARIYEMRVYCEKRITIKDGC